METKRAITINRSMPEVERAWHDFFYAKAWRGQVMSTQLAPAGHSRGTLLRVHLTKGVKTDEVELALRQFKAIQEAGEIPSTDGQPAGGRGVLHRIKEQAA